MLAVARDLLVRPARRDVWCLAFGSEESGILGSSWFVKHAAGLKERLHAMVNMDMVGRMQGRSLLVHGVDSGKGLRSRMASRISVSSQAPPA